MAYQTKPKLEVMTNIPVSITIQNYNNPREGEGQYGKYFILDVIHNGSEKVLFLNEKQFLGMKKDFEEKHGVVTILKSEVDMGGGRKPYPTWSVVKENLKPAAQFNQDLNESTNRELSKKKEIDMEDREFQIKWGLSCNMASRLYTPKPDDSVFHIANGVRTLAEAIYTKIKERPNESLFDEVLEEQAENQPDLSSIPF